MDKRLFVVLACVVGILAIAWLAGCSATAPMVVTNGQTGAPLPAPTPAYPKVRLVEVPVEGLPEDDAMRCWVAMQQINPNRWQMVGSPFCEFDFAVRNAPISILHQDVQ